VVSRPLEGEVPTIDLAVGYSKANTSPILKLFLSRLEELRAPMLGKKNIDVDAVRQHAR
jgi:LysR family transcriptional regulator, hca operon transcriptional activator